MWWAQCSLRAGPAEKVSILPKPFVGQTVGEFVVYRVYAPKLSGCRKCGHQLSGADSVQHAGCQS